MSSPFPVLRIWEVCQPDFGSELTIDLHQGAVSVLVRRHEFSVIAEVVPPGDFAMLSALAKGEEFADAYDRAQAVDNAFDPAAFLQKYVLSGVLVDFAVPADAIE